MKDRTTDITIEADSKVFDENNELKIYTVKDYPSDTTLCGMTPERVIMEYGNDTEIIEWIYKTDKTLFIYGIGQMKEYSETATKTWNTKKEDCEHIEIDENIETITKQSFKDFIKVQDIRIPTSVNTIGEYILRGCIALGQIIVTNGNGNYSSDANGVLYHTSSKTLLQYPLGKETITEYSIPSGVEIIEEYAFDKAQHLTSITIENEVTTLKDYSFQNITTLKK